MREASNPVPDATNTSSAAPRVRAFRELFRAVDDLRAEVRQERRRERSWKRSFVALGLVSTILAGGLVAALTATSSTLYGLKGETTSLDTTTFSLTLNGQGLAGVTAAAIGTTNSYAAAVDLLAANAGVAQTALTVGHWTYTATVAEASANSFVQSLTAYYKVELFVDGASQGAIYIKNGVGDAINAEGVVVKWGLGATLPVSGSYVVKITQIAS